MCIQYRWCIVEGDCPIHFKHPVLGPLEIGHPTPAASCTKKEAEYILQACGTPPPEDDEDDEDDDEDDGVEDDYEGDDDDNEI